jgi:two-component system OmpR family response regulator
MARILIIDDDAHLRLLYWSELTRDGHSVRVARDAAAAIRAARGFGPDLIVMEADLPTCCRSADWNAARARGDVAAPVIVNSGCAEAALTCEALGADAWVVKSPDLGPLRAAIRGVIGRERVSAGP